MKPYYYIHRPGYGSPTVRHETMELALTEAKRLARHNPGESFEILQCVGITTMTEPHTFWVDGVIPPHVCAMHRIMDDTCVVCGKSLA